jgi:hypothetical protein
MRKPRLHQNQAVPPWNGFDTVQTENSVLQTLKDDTTTMIDIPISLRFNVS